MNPTKEQKKMFLILKIHKFVIFKIRLRKSPSKCGNI